MKLSEKDIRLIRMEMRLGYTLPLLLLAFCVLFNVIYLLIFKQEASLWLVGGVDAGVLLLCSLLYFGLNRKHLRDLRNGEKKIVRKPVVDKMEVKSHEAGSGLPYIPILGDIFPKLWKKPIDRTYLYYFVVEGYRYMVEPEIFARVEKGDEVEMYYTLNGNLLGFGIPENK